MNCIIIDEREGCKQIEESVAKCSSLFLTGSFSEPYEALDHIVKRRNIGLVFIDVKSVGPESFELIGNLENEPNMIVVSSSDEYATMAFDYNVVDYIMKPVNFARFTRAVDRAIRLNQFRQPVSNDDHEIFFRKDFSLIKLKLNDIQYVESLENYITLVTADRRYTIHYTMKGIENQLPREIFSRVHRSFLVNKKFIKTINESTLDLETGDSTKNIPVGKSYRSLLLNDLNIMDRKNLAANNQVMLQRIYENDYEQMRSAG